MKGTGEVVPYIEKMTPEIEAMAQGTSHTTSVGGMISKLTAAKIAHRVGCGVTIGSGQDSELFNKLLAGERVGTYFAPSDHPIKSYKRWIAIQDNTRGTLTIDDGAATALQQSGKSLLAAGITASEGDFEPGDVIKICTTAGHAIAHGLVAINASDLSTIIDLSPEAFQAQCPTLHSSVIVHRDNLALLD